MKIQAHQQIKNSYSVTPMNQTQKAILDWTDEIANTNQRNASQNQKPSIDSAFAKNRSHSVEKLIKHFPDALAKTNEIETILEARRRGSKNDSSSDLIKAFNFVKQDPDCCLSVKLEHNHAQLTDFAKRSTVNQKCLTPNEIGKGKAKKLGGGKRKNTAEMSRYD